MIYFGNVLTNHAISRYLSAINEHRHANCNRNQTPNTTVHPQEPLPLGRTDDLLQYTEEIWQDLDDASSRVAALHRAEALPVTCYF